MDRLEYKTPVLDCLMAAAEEHFRQTAEKLRRIVLPDLLVDMLNVELRRRYDSTRLIDVGDPDARLFGIQVVRQSRITL